MDVRNLFAVLLLLPSLAGAVCDAPPFEPFTQKTANGDASALTAVEIQMQPVATLRIPEGFAKLGAMPHGSFIFSGHPQGFSGVLSFETKETIAAHRKGVTPAYFMRSIFRGLDKTGCRYMQAQQLANEDYRLHATLDQGAELFAYGKASTHHFYVIHPKQPNFVLGGLFKNMSQADVELILSTITIK